MSFYLLSAQCVYDIIRMRGLPGEIWMRNLDSHQIFEQDIYISSITPMTIRDNLEHAITKARQNPGGSKYSLTELRHCRKQADKFMAGFASGNRIVPMSHQIAECWGDLLDTNIEYKDDRGTPYAISSAQKVDLATAIVGSEGFAYTYVCHYQAAHETIAGLDVENV